MLIPCYCEHSEKGGYSLSFMPVLAISSQYDDVCQIRKGEEHKETAKSRATLKQEKLRVNSAASLDACNYGKYVTILKHLCLRQHTDN